MTRKDYIAIAGAIRKADSLFGSFDGSDTESPSDGIAAVIDELLVVFKTDNPRFDAALFVEAC